MRRLLAMAFLLAAITAACGDDMVAPPSPSPTPTPVTTTPVPVTPLPTGSPTTTPTATLVPTLTATPTETATPAPTETPEPAEIPDRPDDFGAYGEAIAAYLAAGGGLDDCLHELVTAWEMPGVALGRCAIADVSGDGADEVVLYATDPAAEPGFGMGTLYLFERLPGGFAPVTLAEVLLGPDGIDSGIVAVEDLDGHAGAEVIALSTTCGASTCFSDVLIYGFDGASHVLLADPPPNMSFATVDVVDYGDTKAVLLYGGTLGSIGAGPQRARTETWAWDETAAAFVLANVAYDPSDYLFFTVMDADAAFALALGALPDARAELDTAEQLYEQALAGTGLVDWHAESGFGGSDHDYLDPYILFKLARIAGIRQLPGTEDLLLTRAISDYPGAFFARVAEVYRDTLSCQAVTDFIIATGTDYEAAWDFGYGNPPPEPAAVCGVTGQ